MLDLHIPLHSKGVFKQNLAWISFHIKDTLGGITQTTDLLLQEIIRDEI